MVSLSEPIPLTLYYDDGKTMTYEPVDLLFQMDRESGVAQMTWNREDTLNALTPTMVQETLYVLEQVKRDPSLKVLLWTAKGRAFCSGAAVKGVKGARTYPKVPVDLLKQYDARGMKMSLPKDIALKSLTLACWQFPKIIVGAINGLAVGGGANIVLCNFCDFVLVADDARFKYPFAELGITPELSSSLIIPLQLGFARGKDLLLTGRWFTAKEVCDAGLVTSLHPKDKLYDAAVAVAKQAAVNYAAVSGAKQLMNGHYTERLSTILDLENKTIQKVITHPESRWKLMAKM